MLWMGEPFERSAYEANYKMVEDLAVHRLSPLYQTSPQWSCKKYLSSIKSLILFTYLGGGLMIQHYPAHIQNHCCPVEE